MRWDFFPPKLTDSMAGAADGFKYLCYAMSFSVVTFTVKMILFG